MRIVLFLLRCLVGLCAAIGFFLVAAAIALAVFLGRSDLADWDRGPDSVPETAVLTFDLAGGLAQTQAESPLSFASFGDTLVLRDSVAALEAAGRDPRIKGVVARLGRGNPGLAEIQELRDALLAFRAQGKFAIGFAESFGEGGDGTLHYYLASAFDRVWMQPSGDLDLVGMRLQSPFIRDLLDEVGVIPRLDQREEYKGAKNTFTDSSMPEPVRQNLQQLVDSWLAQVVEGIAAERGLEVPALRALVDRAPYKAAQALNLGLVDALGYWDQVSDEALAQAGGDSPGEAEGAAYISLDDYAQLAREEEDEDAPVVALIHGLGAVTLDGSRSAPVFDQLTMGSETVAGAISDALDDESVKAIVFRVDSPGGSYVASDTIWREVVRAREQGVPLIVTMGNVAASGGYFVAAAAHKIVAQPGTITGSIGVVSGKYVLTGLWDEIGVEWDGVRAGRNADIWNMNRDFTPAQWGVLQKNLDAVYADFTGKVAEGRGLTLEQTLAAAKGQVWSGRDALELGLVDSLGGYGQAMALAREAAGLGPEDAVRVRPFPDQRTPLSAFLESTLGIRAATQGGALASFADSLGRLFQVAAPLLRRYDELTADPRSRLLTAPAAVIR